MLRSMTGFGYAEKTFPDYNISVEFRAVNHRFLEFTPKVPRGYVFLEEKLKTLVQKFVSRGKLDAYLSIQQISDEAVTVEVNHSLANGYVTAIKSLSETYNLLDDISVSLLAGFNDIFIVQKQVPDEDKIWSYVSDVASAALHTLVSMRETEGAKLREDLENRLSIIEGKIALIESQSPQTVELYRERLEQRIKELLGDAKVDEQRLLTETAVFADKIAVSEETVRLRSHISQFRILMESDEPVGRKLDFMVQEMNREANTIGSKAQDITISHTVVDIKAEIEKIREQVQNIE